MRVVALISGGKDSCFNMMHCVANGHDIVALANLRPPAVSDEMDSHMFQTVGHDVIDMYAEAMGLPLFRRTITGSSVCTTSDYTQDQTDEVEDLLALLLEVKNNVDYDAVSSGAILSNYQRVRVENVCRRLRVQSLAYLWQRDQAELLAEMIQANVDAVLIKVASLGLNPRAHLGKTLAEMSPHLHAMNTKYDLNVCGEGGEYETLTLDCPLFCKKIVIDEKKLVMDSDVAFAPVGYLTFDSVHVADKGMNEHNTLSQRLGNCDLVLPKMLKTDEFHHLQTMDVKCDQLRTLTCDTKSSGNIAFNPSSHQINVCEGRGWITEIFCVKNGNSTIEEATSSTMETLLSILSSEELAMGDISLVNLFCSSMKNFSQINSVYKKFFHLNPPARVCVEIPLPPEIVFKMDVCIDHSLIHPRKALHVESISYWAPANIGPYSQVVRVSPRTYFSGSIGMDPSSLNVVTGGFEQEATLALHHIHRVANVFTPDFKSNGSHGIVTCYVTDLSKAPYIVAFFNHQRMLNPSTYILSIVGVPALPKGASVEWHVVASHKDEYMENNDDEDGSDAMSCDVVKTGEHLCYNPSFSKLIIPITNAEDEPLFHLLTEHRSTLVKCQFIRVYYTLPFINNSVEDVKNSFIGCWSMAIRKHPSISFIPVRGLENVAAMMVVGINSA